MGQKPWQCFELAITGVTPVLPAMSLEQVTVSYAALDDQGVFQLKLDGQVVAETPPRSSGAEVVVYVERPQDAGSYETTEYLGTGKYMAIGLNAPQVSDELLNRQIHTLNEAALARKRRAAGGSGRRDLPPHLPDHARGRQLAVATRPPRPRDC